METTPIPLDDLPMTQPQRPLPSKNDVLNEILKAHGTLSEPAKRAVEMANMTPKPVPMGPPPVVASSPGAIPMPKPSLDEPPAAGAIPVPKGNALAGMPPVNPGAITVPSAMPPRPQTPQHIPVPQDPRLQQAQNNAWRLGQTGPGVSQIHPAGIRIPLQILDAIGSGLFPNIAMGIPGTTAHHQLLSAGANNQVASLENQQNEAVKRAGEEATRAKTEADTNTLIPAQAEHEKAATEALAHPKSEGKTIETADGIMQWNPQTEKYDIPVGEAPGKNSTQHVVTSDGSVIAIHTNAKNGETTHEVVYKGEPKANVELTKLEVNGKPHTVVYDKNSNTVVKDLGETGEKPPTVNVNSEGNREDRSYDKRNAELNAIGKPIADLNQRLGRLNDTIAQNSPQADALVAPELLTVMAGGAGSGLRMNEAEIARIVGGRSKWQDLQAAINKWKTDPKAARSITTEQQQQIHALVKTVGDKLQQKQDIMNDAYQQLSATDDVKEHRRIVNGVRDAFSKIDKGEGAGAENQLSVTYNGHEFTFKDQAMMDKFKADQGIK